MPYIYAPQRIHNAQLFDEDNREISLTPRETIPVKSQALLEILAPTILPSKVDSEETITIQGVLRQLRFDQGMVTITGELSISSALVVEARFIGQGVHQILASKQRFFSPRLACARVRSPGRELYWQKCVGFMNAFVTEQDKGLLEVPLHNNQTEWSILLGYKEHGSP